MPSTSLRTIKAEEARRRTEAVAALRGVLAAYARAHGGRYLLYGSAARGGMRYHSDVDILLDFPPDQQREAWNFAERGCAEWGIEADIMPLAWCQDDFLDHIRPDLVALS